MTTSPHEPASCKKQKPATAGYGLRDVLVLRWALLILVAASTGTATLRLWAVLRIDGPDAPKLLFLFLFLILFGWISTSFWVACIGALLRLLGIRSGILVRSPPHEARARTSRTAIAVPIFNEDVKRVFGGIAAMAQSLSRAGAEARFDFYVLSDTRDPALQEAESHAWLQLARALGIEGQRLYYRHRRENIGRKSGNLADFLRNWGSLYDYMIVLDADSLMTGKTIVTLAALMDENPRAALIQVPPQLVGRNSVFGRLQQFASSAYGPLVAEGLASLQGADGNYWGHNAIIRVAPFMRHCGLPALSGRAPLGGEILSHDFVEAALLRSAGWDVHLAPDLGGSYEEPPPTLIDYLKRDRRWCQGNLQHLRLVFAQGLRLPSRLHLLFGVMSYLASPLWLIMLMASGTVAYESHLLESFTYVGRYPLLRWQTSHVFELATLVLAVTTMLFGPKLLALAVLLRDRAMREAHGGALAATASVLLECILSALVAPITMLSQCGFVASILLGSSAEWSAQRRREHTPRFVKVLRVFLPHTLIAVAAAYAVHAYLPDSVGWFLPLFVGAALAVPFAIVTSSTWLGRTTRDLGLFLVPSETIGIPELGIAGSGRVLQSPSATPSRLGSAPPL